MSNHNTQYQGEEQFDAMVMDQQEFNSKLDSQVSFLDEAEQRVNSSHNSQSLITTQILSGVEFFIDSVFFQISTESHSGNFTKEDFKRVCRGAVNKLKNDSNITSLRSDYKLMKAASSVHAPDIPNEMISDRVINQKWGVEKSDRNVEPCLNVIVFQADETDSHGLAIIPGLSVESVVIIEFLQRSGALSDLIDLEELLQSYKFDDNLVWSQKSEGLFQTTADLATNLPGVSASLKLVRKEENSGAPYISSFSIKFFREALRNLILTPSVISIFDKVEMEEKKRLEQSQKQQQERRVTMLRKKKTSLNLDKGVSNVLDKTIYDSFKQAVVDSRKEDQKAQISDDFVRTSEKLAEELIVNPDITYMKDSIKAGLTRARLEGGTISSENIYWQISDRPTSIELTSSIDLKDELFSQFTNVFMHKLGALPEEVTLKEYLTLPENRKIVHDEVTYSKSHSIHLDTVLEGVSLKLSYKRLSPNHKAEYILSIILEEPAIKSVILTPIKHTSFQATLGSRLDELLQKIKEMEKKLSETPKELKNGLWGRRSNPGYRDLEEQLEALKAEYKHIKSRVS